METLTVLSVKIPKGLKARLAKAAKREGRSLSSFTRFHLDEKLNEADADPTSKKREAVSR